MPLAGLIVLIVPCAQPSTVAPAHGRREDDLTVLTLEERFGGLRQGTDVVAKSSSARSGVPQEVRSKSGSTVSGPGGRDGASGAGATAGPLRRSRACRMSPMNRS